MLGFYRDTCLPWIEDTRSCAVCGIDTESNDILCDDCHEYADSEEELDFPNHEDDCFPDRTDCGSI